MISVIIPCFNAAPWIDDCIESVLQQQYPVEIIIVDDFSTDESWNKIAQWQQKFPEVIKGVKNAEKGGNNARNYGFQYSSGEYIQWLDADDVLLPGKLKAQANYLDKHPETDIVYSGWQLNNYDAEGNLLNEEVMPSGPFADFLLELLKDNWRPPNAYLVRRKMAEYLHEIKGWNPQTPAAQDREYFTRAAIAGAVFSHVPGNFAMYKLKKIPTVSSALGGKRKSEVVIRLLYNFMSEIDRQPSISPSKKRLYHKVAYTQIACLATYFYLPMNNVLPTFTTIRWIKLKDPKLILRIFYNILVKKGRSGQALNPNTKQSL